MAIIVRNTGGDPLALAAAIAQNLEAQSSSIVSSFFHADSTSNAQTPDAAFGIPQTPQGQFVTQSLSVDLLSAQQLAFALAGALIGGGATSDPPAHFYDAPLNSKVQAGAHKVNETVNTALLNARNVFVAAGGVGGAPLAATQTFATAIKTFFNAHLTQAGIHYNNDTLNTELNANASDLASTQTLVNSLRNRINNHISAANPNYPQIRVIDP